MKLSMLKPIQGFTALLIVLFGILAIIAALNEHWWLATFTVLWIFVGCGYWEEIILAAEEDEANMP